jgi:tyrosine-protein kinase Etk/Wzc
MTHDVNSDAKKIGLIDFGILMLEDIRVFVLCLALAAVAGLGACSLIASRYTARAVVAKPLAKRPINFKSLAGKNSRIARILESVSQIEDGNVNDFLAVLSSRRLGRDAMGRFNLVKAYGFDKHAGYCIEDVLKRYFRSLTVAEDERGNIVVSVSDRDPMRAADMANFLVGDLDTVIRYLSREHARNSRLFFEERLSAIKHDLDSASRLLAQFQADNNFVDLDQQVDASVGSLAGLEGERMAVDLQIARLRSEFGLANPHLSELEEQEMVVQRKIGEYMDRGGGAVVVALRDLPERTVLFGKLLRDAEIQKTLYEFVLQFREQAKIEESSNIHRVHVLEPAEVPEKRTQPQGAIVWLMFFFGGGILTSFGILLRRWWNVQRRYATPFYAKAARMSALLAPSARVPRADGAGERLQ